MTISIVITAYNLEDYIEAAVESALAQAADEVIVVDDGSTDRTRQLIEGMVTRNPRLKLVVKENGGSSSARNAGAKAATGDYLLFLDGDDILLRGATSELTAILEKSNNAVCAYGQWHPIGQQGEELPSKMKMNSSFNGNVLRHILTRGFLMPGCALVRRTAFDKVGGFNEEIAIAEDWEFFCRLAHHGDFLSSNRVVLAYRLRKSSKSANINPPRVVKLYGTIDHVFSNPDLRNFFSDRKIYMLKRKSRACAVLGVSNRDFWDGNRLTSLKRSALAVKEYPPIFPRIVARYIFNLLLFFSSSRESHQI